MVSSSSSGSHSLSENRTRSLTAAAAAANIAAVDQLRCVPKTRTHTQLASCSRSSCRSVRVGLPEFERTQKLLLAAILFYTTDHALSGLHALKSKRGRRRGKRRKKEEEEGRRNPREMERE